MKEADFQFFLLVVDLLIYPFLVDIGIEYIVFLTTRTEL